MLTGHVCCVCISFSVIIAPFSCFDQGPLGSFILIMYIVVGLYFPLNTWSGYCTTVPFLLFLSMTPPKERGLFLVNKKSYETVAGKYTQNSKFSEGACPRTLLVKGAFGTLPPPFLNICWRLWCMLVSAGHYIALRMCNVDDDTKSGAKGTKRNRLPLQVSSSAFEGVIQVAKAVRVH